MYKDVLQAIEGVNIYPIISMFLFMLFFIGIIIWIFRLDKKYINKMENLPFDSYTISENQKGKIDG
ncbi:MAG: cbb3-type cytochrome c oxidase subunit 3 [Calditrichaceae bacterium]